jgi:NAD(P)-dependent dehydrogenase (short-subunit alcohol dehydrogenase family)
MSSSNLNMLSGGTIVLTGANGGLGSAIVARILSDSSLAQTHHGIYTVRNDKSAENIKAVLQKSAQSGHTYDLLPLDLSSLSSARTAAAEINRRVKNGDIPPVRALILNAGWQEYTTQTITKDGFDMAFQVNYLSHFLLTLLLLQSMDPQNGRIVVLGSWSHEYNTCHNLITCL